MTIERQIVLGIFVDLIAAPFCYEGCTAVMNKEWGKAIGAYIVGIPLALIGLSIVGIIPVSSAWVTPIVEPLATDGRWWLVVLLFVLLWIGGPRFVASMRTAWRKGGFRPQIVYDHFADERNMANIYTHLWFRNEPTCGAAWDVVARITWTPKNKRGHVLFAGNAKWKEIRWNLGRAIYAANHIDLANDGKPHALDLCVRKAAAFECYWLDIESSNIGAFHPDRLIQPGIYDVYVEFSCDGYAAQFRSEVEITGTAPPHVTPIA
jgi:hypothetical protein